MNGVLPCPFCGSLEIAVYKDVARCVECGAGGPIERSGPYIAKGRDREKDAEIAVRNWNRRACKKAHFIRVDRDGQRHDMGEVEVYEIVEYEVDAVDTGTRPDAFWTNSGVVTGSTADYGFTR